MLTVADLYSSPQRGVLGTSGAPLRKERSMRACMLFVTGLLVGVGLHTVAAQSSKSPNHDLVQMNHVGMNVPDINATVEYYTKQLGFPEAFRVNDDKGQP